MSALITGALSNPEATRVAEALLEARRSGTPADASALAGCLQSADDAYAVQACVAQALEGCASGMARYWKSGGPSRQATATHAPLPPAGVWPSPAQAGSWPCNMRLIEAEIALRLGQAVSPAEANALSHDHAAALVDAMTVSIELVDSRWREGVQASPLLKLADLQSHGALVLGEWTAFQPRDWSAQKLWVRIGEAAHAFQGTHSMGDPAWVLPAWLRHATRHGDTVARGTVVTTGTWCGMLPAGAGDLVTVRFEGAGEASLQL